MKLSLIPVQIISPVVPRRESHGLRYGALKIEFLIVLSRIYRYSKGNYSTSDSIKTVSPVESEIVRVFSLCTTKITEITRLNEKIKKKTILVVQIPQQRFIDIVMKPS